MARKSLLELLLAGAAIATFGGCNGCEGTGQLNPDDDDDDTTTEAPYTAEDINLDCYATEGDLSGDNPFTATEGTGVLCVLDAPQEFFDEGNLLYSERSIDLETSGFSSEPTIDDANHTVNMNFDMYDANATELEDGTEVSLGEHVPTVTLKITDDPYMDDMDITATFDPVYLENQAPSLTSELVDLGRIMVGEDIPGFNLLTEAGVTDREDDLVGNGDYHDNESRCESDDVPASLTLDDNCDLYGTIEASGDFEFDVSVVDPQGDSATVTVTGNGYSNPVVTVRGIDFLTSTPLSGYVWAYCEDQGTPDFTYPSILNPNPYQLDINGEVEVEIESDALAAGVQEIDCYFAVDNDVDAFDVSGWAGIILSTPVNSSGAVNPIEADLLVPESYDGNAQAATGVDDAVEHLLAREKEMRANEGLPDLSSATDMISMGSGVITSEMIDGDPWVFGYSLSDYVNNMDPTLSPQGFSGVLVQDAANGQVTLNWNYDAGVLDVNRVFNGTNIDSGEVILDNEYGLDAKVMGEGILIATGAIAGTPIEGNVLDENRDFSNGSAYEFDLAQKQLLMRQFYQHDLDQICVEFEGYNPCDGIMPNYFGDGPIDN